MYVRHGLDHRVGHVRRFCIHAGLIKSLVSRVMGLLCPMRALIGRGRSYDRGPKLEGPSHEETALPRLGLAYETRKAHSGFAPQV